MITATQFRQLDQLTKLDFINSLCDEEARALYYDWEFWARPDQLEPEGLGKDGKFIWFMKAGRGYGKTRTFTEWVNDKIRYGGYRYITFAGAVSDEVRSIMIEGESGVLACSSPDFYPKYEPSKKKLTWPNGAKAIIVYGSEPEKSRGIQSDLIWCDELAKWKYPEATFDNLMLGLRLGKNPLCGVSTTPKPTRFIKELIARDEVIVTGGHTNDNLENLADPFIQTITTKYKGTRLGRQELNAEILDDNPNALWTRLWIDKNRLTERPDLYKIVTAVDPATTDSESSDENGIVVVGEGKALSNMQHFKLPHYYILDDLSIIGSPGKWADTSIWSYRQYMCDRIIAEKNQGGLMVKSTIKNVDESVPVSLVWASRGKWTRAEPVSALYEQGRVHHVGSFPDMEDELCEWVPGDPSPSRLDALVWGVSWLAGFNNVPSDIKVNQLTERTRSKIRLG